MTPEFVRPKHMGKRESKWLVCYHKASPRHLANAAEANLAAVVAKCAGSVLVVLDHTKFEQTAPHCGLETWDVDVIVTDQTPGQNLTNAIQAWGIDLHLALGEGQNAQA